MRLSRHLDLIAIAITLACFWRICLHDFVVYDDSVHVRTNPYFNPPTWPNLLQFWTKPYEGLYIPVTYTAWGGLAALTSTSGVDGTEHDPQAFHCANLLVHLLSVLIVFSLLELVMHDPWAAFGGALLFGLHPLQVEPVAWISGFRDALAGFFLLAAVWQYLCFAAAPSGGRRRYLYYGLATLAFVLAMLSKPAAVVAPLAAGIIGCLMLQRPLRRVVADLLPWVALAVPVVLVTRMSQPGAKIDFITPLWQRPLIAGDALTFYLRKLTVPLWLGPDYGRTPQYVLRHGWVWLTGLLPFALAALLLWRYRRKWLMSAAGVFLVALLPVLGLLPFAFQNISTVADRYVYFAMLGPALALAWLIKGRRAWAVAVCVLLLGFFGVRSACQVRHWQNTTTLFQHALYVNPASSLSHVNLGVFAQRQGRLEEAIAHYNEALRVNPKEVHAHYNLGMIQQKSGRPDLATRHYMTALRINPHYTQAHYALATVLQEQGELDRAFTHFSKALELTSRWTHFIYTRMASIREQQGQLDEAIELYSKALEIKPGHARARAGLNRVMAKKKREGTGQ